MNKALITLAVLVLALGALAQKPKKKPPVPTAKTKVHCAVMTTSWVTVADATKSKMFADYKGRRYFFCCGGCPEAFKANPAKFAKSDSIPTPKKPKRGKIA